MAENENMESPENTQVPESAAGAENTDTQDNAQPQEILKDAGNTESGEPGESAQTQESAEKPKNGKVKKIKKAPGFYRKFLTPEALQKKYFKYIEVPIDKDFISSCYEKKEDGFYIRNDLDVDEVKRLKVLAGAIRKNRKGPVNLLPLGFVAALVAAVFIFFSIFANPLLGRALEAGLEAIFEARCEARNFRLSILKFEITLDGLSIADRDSPMRNLIQFNRMAIRLKPNAVLRGRIYIEEIRADAIRFATPRTVSGALPDKPPKEKKSGEKLEIPMLVDLQNFDAMALLNQEFNKLQTPKLYGEAMDAYETASAKWKSQADSARARAEELRSQAQPFLALNINDYRTLDMETVERIRKTIEDIQTLTDTVQKSVDDVNGIVRGAQDDFATATSLVQHAKNSITDDFSHLKSYVDISSGAALGVLEPVARNLLTDAAETYIEYGNRALEILEKVKTLQAMLPKSAPKPPKTKKFRGRDVVFPVIAYPRFFLGTLATDVLTPGNWHWGFDLRGVSSDPDLSGLPTTLALSLGETGDGLRRTAGFKGMADFRSNISRRFTADLSGGGFPVDFSAQLKQIGIGGFNGSASFSLGLTGMTDGSFTGSGDISLADSRIIDPSNTITRAISQAMSEVRSLDLGILYEHRASSRDSFSMTTNIAEILAEALRKIVDQYKEIAFRELERILNEKLASYIDGASISQKDLENIVKIVQGDKAAVDQLKNTLTAKKDEFEQRLRSTVEDAAKQAVEEAKEELKAQGEQAVQDILQGNAPQIQAPSITVPSLPSIPGIRR